MGKFFNRSQKSGLMHPVVPFPLGRPGIRYFCGTNPEHRPRVEPHGKSAGSIPGAQKAIVANREV